MTVVSLLSVRAHAQDVALDMRECPSPRAADVRAVLAVELQEELLPEGAAPTSDARIVLVHCTSDSAELQLRGTSTTRTIALSNVPAELRARVLALSIAELVRPRAAPEAEPQEQSTPSVAATAAPAAGEPATRAAEEDTDHSAAGQEAVDDAEAEDESATDARSANGPSHSYQAWLGAEFQAAPIFGLGGSAFFDAQLGDWLAWASALGLSHANTTIDGGELNVLALSLRTGLAFALRSSRGSLHAGAGIRGQWEQLDGVPGGDATEAASFSVWSLGPSVFAGASWQFAPPAFLALELDAAYLREVHAQVEGGDATSLSPWRAVAVVGAGLSW